MEPLKNIAKLHFLHQMHFVHEKWPVTYMVASCLYNFDPLKPHFYIVKLGFTGVYVIFLISTQKHRMWVFEAVLTSTHNLCFEQKCGKYQSFLSEKKNQFFLGEIFYIFE